MKTIEWHLAHAEALLEAAENEATIEPSNALTQRAAVHVQFAQALAAQHMMEATAAMQKRTVKMLDDTSRLVDS